MAGGTWNLYNDFKANSYKKLMNLTSDTIKVALVTSGSNAIDVTFTPALYSGITNEVANGNGYTTTGATASSPTVSGGGGTATITFDTSDVAWTGSGSGFTLRGAVIYDSTSGNLIAWGYPDDTPADVVVGSGVTLTLTIGDVFAAS